MQALVVVAVAVAVVDVTGAVLTDCYFLGQRPEHAESQGQAKAAKAATGSPRLLRHEPSLLVTRYVKLGFQQSNFLVSELARVPVDAKVQHGACVAGEDGVREQEDVAGGHGQRFRPPWSCGSSIRKYSPVASQLLVVELPRAHTHATRASRSIRTDPPFSPSRTCGTGGAESRCDLRVLSSVRPVQLGLSCYSTEQHPAPWRPSLPATVGAGRAIRRGAHLTFGLERLRMLVCLLVMLMVRGNEACFQWATTLNY